MDNSQSVDDPLKVYLTEVSKVPRLSPSAEKRCLHLIQTGGQEAKSAKKDLVEANLCVVVAIAERYTNQSIHLLDLIQAGNQGLIDAVETLSEDFHEGFAEHATPYIETAIKNVSTL